MSARSRALSLLILTTLVSPVLAQQDRQPSQAALYAKFARTMTNATLIGVFTDNSAPEGSGPHEESYTLGRVAKIGKGDKWGFEAKIEYGGKSFTVPLQLDVLWAGDTPVITLTNLTLPLMGTYTARVMIYDDQYVGFWSGGDHGGQMYGRIEHAAPESDDEKYVHWPQFRGPGAGGTAEGFPTVTEWDVESGKNVKWNIEIPGLAHSSPVIWGDKIYVTSAVSMNLEDELKVGLYGDIRPVENEGMLMYYVHCFDKNTGILAWGPAMAGFGGEPQVKRHPKGSHAACTPATDGKRLVAFFGSEGLFCYDMDLNPKWEKNLGLLDSGFYRDPSMQWGFSSSPVIFEDRVYVQCDIQGKSFVAAFDAETGEEVWRTAREEVPTWGTPTIHVSGDRRQLICNGWRHIGGYDLDTGKELWKLEGGGDIPVPTPIVAHDLIFITNAHGRQKPIYAIDAFAEGTITVSSDFMAWNSNNLGNYMQTPLVYETLLYCCKDNGVLRAFDSGTGDKIYDERVGSGDSGYTASMVGADGKLYVTSEEGEVSVVRAGPEFEVLAVNDLGEECMATPAISAGVLYFRTRGHLIAIGG